jgi:hypothetical protein
MADEGIELVVEESADYEMEGPHASRIFTTPPAQPAPAIRSISNQVK